MYKDTRQLTALIAEVHHEKTLDGLNEMAQNMDMEVEEKFGKLMLTKKIALKKKEVQK